MKTKKEFRDYLPLNSRIVIDYTKPEKNMVLFSYPSLKKKDSKHKKRIFLKETFTLLFNWWTIENVIAWSIAFLIIGISMFIMNYDEIISASSTASIINTKDIITLGAILLYFCLPPIILTLIFFNKQELSSRLLPQIGLWNATTIRGGTYCVRITKKDLIEGNKAVIPYFKNFFLNYRTIKDFAKQLERVEIIEYPMKFLNKKSRKTNKRNKTEWENNSTEWRATFYFKRTPETGYLEVDYL